MNEWKLSHQGNSKSLKQALRMITKLCKDSQNKTHLWKEQPSLDDVLYKLCSTLISKLKISKIITSTRANLQPQAESDRQKLIRMLKKGAIGILEDKVKTKFMVTCRVFRHERISLSAFSHSAIRVDRSVFKLSHLETYNSTRDHPFSKSTEINRKCGWLQRAHMKQPRS